MLSVSSIVDFYRCKACFTEVFLYSKRRGLSGKSLVGIILHQFFKEVLLNEVRLIAELEVVEKINLKTIFNLYSALCRDIYYDVLSRYESKLGSLDVSIEVVERLLKRLSKNVVEKRCIELFKNVKNFDLSSLLPMLSKRRMDVKIVSSRYGVCGSPDVIEPNLVYEFKYSRPTSRGLVREDFLLQVVWYSILSETCRIQIFYLPSVLHTDLIIDNSLKAWAIKIRNEVLEFLNGLDNIDGLEHTCGHGVRYLPVGGWMFEKGIPIFITNITSIF